MTALIGNPLLLTSAPAEEDDAAYQIEKSLRFNDPDTAYLSTTNSIKGNRTTWTYAFWLKQGHYADDAHVFGAHIDTNNRDNIYFGGDNWFGINMKNGGSWHIDKYTARFFRDSTAWMHIVIRFDTTQSVAVDRVRIYVNGKEVTTWGGSPTHGNQYAESIINAACKHWIGAGPENDGSLQSTYLNSYLADLYFIDGLSLAPGAFGSFDKTGVWTPKAFAMPAPNKGVTHSSTLVATNNGSSASFNGGNPATHAFDGYVVPGTNSNWANILASGAGQLVKLTYTPATAISNPSTVRVFTYTGDSGDRVYIRFNGKGRSKSIEELGYTLQTSAWVDASELLPKGEDITEIAVERTAAGSGSGAPIGGIEIDGVILIDGKTDPTTRNNQNDGTVWSDGTKTGTVHSADDDQTEAFNSNLGDSWLAGTNSTSTLTLPHKIKINTLLEISTQKDSGADDYGVKPTLENAGQITNVDPPVTGSTRWVTYWESSGSPDYLTAIQCHSNSSSKRTNIRAIRVDGHIIYDGATDNSFHLKFNDTSRNNALGKDSLNGKIADSTGGLPIYNTTDDYGEVKGSGYRADSSAGTTNGTGLVLALPGDVLTDEHDHINTGSSAVALTTHGDPAVSANHSRFYGSSIEFDGTGDYLSNSSSNSDFTMGTGDFTIECWVTKSSATTHTGFWQISDTAGGLKTTNYVDTLALGYYVDGSDKAWQWYNDGGSPITAQYPIEANKWYHTAYVRASDVSTLYIDGVAVKTNSSDTANYNGTYVAVGGYYDSNYLHNGNIQDFRIYKGVAKYTGNFTPPARNDWAPTNLLGTADSTYQPILTFQDSTFKDNSHANKTITAVNSAAMISATDSPPTGISYALQSDGTSNKYVTVPNEGFDLSGDFTIEFWMNRSGGDTDWRALVSPDANKGGFFGFTQTTKIGFGRSGVAWDGTSGANKIAADTWHHCVYVREGTNLSAYVDGTREIQSTSNSNDYSITGSTVALGGGENNMVATAQWSNFRVTTDALYDPTSASLTVPTAPLTRKNLSHTADSFTDSPTSYGTDDGLGGEVRSNYCTWDPLNKYGTTTLSEGNLKAVTTTNSQINGTFLMSPTVSGNCTGKWYFEWTCGTNAVMQIGIVDIDGAKSAAPPGGASKNGIIYLTSTAAGDTSTGKLYNNATEITTGWPSTTTNSVVMVAYDAGTGKLWFGKDGTWYNTSGSTGNPATGAHPAITVSADYRAQMTPVVGAGGGSDAANGHANFGQRAFAYEAPSGFRCLCTANLPDTFSGDNLNNPSKFFDVHAYTGNGATITRSPFSFQPDFVWFKTRSHSGGHEVYDVIRTATKGLYPHITNAEATEADGLTAFTANGFTTGDGGWVNTDAKTYVAWAWDAGASVTPSSSYNITPSAQYVNADAGFSITAYTGNASTDQTIPHGLATAPDLIITKSRSHAIDWPYYHSSGTANKGFFLNLTNVENTVVGGADNVTHGGHQGVNNNTWTTAVGQTTDDNVNKNNETYISYAWTSIPGYSKFGGYTGTGADRNTIYTGFRPKFIAIKARDVGESTMLFDAKRDPYNEVDERFLASHDLVANQDQDLGDFLSNGFSIYNNWPALNQSGKLYTYWAFAEHPFKTSRAR